MIAYVFPGQGSQIKGMGKELFEEFKQLTEEASDILGYSIKDLCLEDKNQQLSNTQFTQPALYVVNALSYYKLLNETGIEPDYAAGHSLGEYNALLAGKVFDFKTGLKLVRKRGELMSAATGGGMAAVLGLTAEEIQEVLKMSNLNMVEIANYNTPKQIVLSALKPDIERAKSYFEKAGALRYVELNVSGAFHSSLMTKARDEFEKYIENFEFFSPQIKVISNISAQPYSDSNIKANLVNQINHPVRWTDSVVYLMCKGVNEIKQVGVGNVISGMVKAIQRESGLAKEGSNVNTLKSVLEQPGNDQVINNKSNIFSEKDKQNAATQANLTAAMKLGDDDFKKDYHLKYAYVTGAMFRGVASEELVIKVGNAGCLGFFGTGGLSNKEIEKAIVNINQSINSDAAFGMNLLYNPNNPEKEEQTVDLYLKCDIKNIEASAFMTITASLVKLRLKGIERANNGEIITKRKIIAKISRPEIAELFMSPAPYNIVEKLLAANQITKEEASLSKQIAMADDLCVESDSGGHTDCGVAFALLPSILKLRDTVMKQRQYQKKIRVGAAGGIGTPEAVAAAFVLGADFIVTGSINQCTVEAGTSDTVKDMLQQINVQDTEYAPAGDMFEIGAKVQVMKKGLFFPARANKLYALYKYHNSLEEIDSKTKTQIQEKYFGRSFDEVYEEVKKYNSDAEIEKAEMSPKYKMALVFRWYFGYATQLALNGDEDNKVNFQVHCGPALGAFNQWAKGTPYENWRNRRVDEIGIHLMNATVDYLQQRLLSLNI